MVLNRRKVVQGLVSAPLVAGEPIFGAELVGEETLLTARLPGSSEVITTCIEPMPPGWTLQGARDMLAWSLRNPL